VGFLVVFGLVILIPNFYVLLDPDLLHGIRIDSKQEQEQLHPFPSSSTATGNPEVYEYISDPFWRKVKIPASKERVAAILKDANVWVNQTMVDMLPTWETVTKLYGSEPTVQGLDTCQRYRDETDLANRWLTPAGMFNTGTNLMDQLLMKNCYIPFRETAKVPRKARRGDGILWQVPWGKHNPASWRLRNVAGGRGDSIPDQRHALPIVIVKDPFSWMVSMCHQQYTARWPRTSTHCPNLFLSAHDKKNAPRVVRNSRNGTPPVTVVYNRERGNITHHDSLVHMWNEWNGEYVYKANYPRLMVRFEDLIYHTDKVMHQICDCAGAKFHSPGKITYQISTAKQGNAHKSDVGIVKALIKYGDPNTRIQRYLPGDIDYATQHLDSNMMKIFGYTYPSTSKQ
jgi:hypothetical protein